MDQLKIVWRYTKKYGFWVLCVVGALLVFFVWGQSTKSLQSQFEARKGEIEGKFGQMQTIASTANQPNELLIEKKNNLLRNQSENIYRTWGDLYAAQKELCTWPVPNPDYRKAFEGAYVEKLKDPKYEVRSDARGDYWNNVIKKHLEDIKKTYDLRVSSGESNTEDGAAAAKEATLTGVVAWKETSFRFLTRRFEWQSRPRTWQILMAQEDMWAYEMMLGIIQKTNVGKSDFNASIKEILSILVAEDALGAYSLMKERVLAISDNVPVANAEEDASAGAASAAGDDEDGETSDAELASLLEKGRYVDAKGNPLKYGGVMKTKAQGYHILPVYMKVVINQNDISQFLVHCVNAGIPIEILQVRMKGLSKKALSPLTLAAAQNDIAEVGAAGGKPAPAAAGANAEGSSDNDASSDSSIASNRGPEDVEFELFGLMYFFEPANIKAFESLVGDESEAPAETAEETAGDESAAEPEPAAEATEAPAATDGDAGQPADADKAAPQDVKDETKATEAPADAEAPAEAAPAEEKPAAENEAEPAAEASAEEAQEAEAPAEENAPAEEKPAAENAATTEAPAAENAAEDEGPMIE